jgi:predicted transport protein
MPLYRIQEQTTHQLKLTFFNREKELQMLFEVNLENLLGVRFIASEFNTGDRQRGRIDTLGIDQDGAPTIVEYKKSSKENIINQGLFYLDWLVDHKGDFTIAAQEKLGAEIQIDWSNPRLILIAEEFSKYDKYAVNRIGANIELWTYRLYQENIIQLEQIFIASDSSKKTRTKKRARGDHRKQHYNLKYHLADKPENVCMLMEYLRKQIFELAEEGQIIEKANKKYMGYKHGKNFCEVKPQRSGLKLWLDIPPNELEDTRGMGRDMSNIGHHGTGQVEVKLIDQKDLSYVMDLIRQAYLLTL